MSADEHLSGSSETAPCGMPLAAGQIIAERYRVDGLLAEGGMALVYRGWHVVLEQDIVIKVLKEEYASNAEAVARFLREGRVGAQLHGKHVAHVFDLGRIEGCGPFLVTELFAGQDLAQLLRASGPLPAERAVSLLIAICDAVADVHDNGIVHRDLKPDNLFLAQDARCGHVVKLLDFGISKRLKDTVVLTEPERCLGSPDYMSPEQIYAPQTVHVQSDIWSLGVVLYEMLTGEPPFDGVTVPSVCSSIVRDAYPSLSRKRTVPRALERVVQRCLQKRPRERYGSVQELRNALFSTGLGASSSRSHASQSGLSGSLRPISTTTDQKVREHPAEEAAQRKIALPASTSEERRVVEAEGGSEFRSTGALQHHARRSAPTNARRAMLLVALVVGLTPLVAAFALAGPHAEQALPKATSNLAQSSSTESDRDRHLEPAVRPNVRPGLPGQSVASEEPAVTPASEPSRDELSPLRSRTTGSVAPREPAVPMTPASGAPATTSPRPDSASTPELLFSPWGPWQERSEEHGEHLQQDDLINPYADLR